MVHYDKKYKRSLLYIMKLIFLNLINYKFFLQNFGKSPSVIENTVANKLIYLIDSLIGMPWILLQSLNINFSYVNQGYITNIEKNMG